MCKLWQTLLNTYSHYKEILIYQVEQIVPYLNINKLSIQEETVYSLEAGQAIELWDCQYHLVGNHSS